MSMMSASRSDEALAAAAGLDVDDCRKLPTGGMVHVTASVEQDATVGPGATVGKGAIVRQGATVGKGAIVRQGAIVGKGAIVRQGAIVGEWAIVGQGAIVGEMASIGKGVRIGQDAIVGEGARVGKWARVGERASIGDGARVGEMVRIGEGARVERGARVDCTPFYAIGSRDLICEVGTDEDGITRLAIGCLCKTIDEWRDTYELEGQRSNYTAAQIEEYRAYIECFGAVLEARKQGSRSAVEYKS